MLQVEQKQLSLFHSLCCTKSHFLILILQLQLSEQVPQLYCVVNFPSSTGTLRLQNRLAGAVCPTTNGLLASITAVSQCGGKHTRQLPVDPRVSQWVHLSHALVWPPASKVTTVCSPIRCPAHPNVTAHQLICFVLCHSFILPLKPPVPPLGLKQSMVYVIIHSLCRNLINICNIKKSKLFTYLCKKKSETIS